MRFLIRDLLWLMVVVAVATVWITDRHRQNAKMRALEEIAGLEAVKFFPADWEGKMNAFRNHNSFLQHRIDALMYELQSRGHHVEIDGCNHVYVDRQLAMTPVRQPTSSN